MNRNRRSSILKRTSTVPPGSPTITRRISFHDKKSVKEFSEGPDKLTIWHNSYEEEAVKTLSINKENIEVLPQSVPNKPLKSAMKSSSVSAPAHTSLQMYNDNDMDLTPLDYNFAESNDIVTNNRSCQGPIITQKSNDTIRTSQIPQLIRSPHRQCAPNQMKQSEDMEITQSMSNDEMEQSAKMELTFVQPQISVIASPKKRLFNNTPLFNLDITPEFLHESIRLPKDRNLTKLGAFNVEMTLMEHSTTKKMAAELDQSIAEMKSPAVLPESLFGDDIEEDFFRTIEQMSFDNTSLDNDNENRITQTIGDEFNEMDQTFELCDSDLVPQPETASRRTVHGANLDFTQLASNGMCESMEIENNSIQINIPSTTRQCRKTVYEGQLDITRIDPANEHKSEIERKCVPIDVPATTFTYENPSNSTQLCPVADSVSIDISSSVHPNVLAKSTSSRKTIYDGLLDFTRLDPVFDYECEEVDNRDPVVTASLRKPARDEQSNVTHFDSVTGCESIEIDEPNEIDASAKRTHRQTIYDDQLELTITDARAYNDKIDNECITSDVASTSKKTVQEDKLDLTTIVLQKSNMELPNILQTESPKQQSELQKNPVETFKSESREIHFESPKTLSKSTKCGSNEEKPKTDQTFIYDQTIIVDSDRTTHSVIKRNPFVMSTEAPACEVEPTFDLDMTQMPNGMGTENASLDTDISETFRIKRGLFSSTQIAGSNNALNEDMELELDEEGESINKNLKHELQSVKHCTESVRPQDNCIQRNFDQTLNQVEKEVHDYLDNVSDTVLATGQIEVSSSMRLFRTNSQETTTNTTEELCNLNAEQICKKEKPHRYDSIRLSGLQKHINVTLSQSDDEDFETQSKAEPLPVDAINASIELRCSTGTPNDSFTKMCQTCPNCLKRRSASPLGAFPPLLARDPSVNTGETLSLDYSGYDRLNMFMTEVDVLQQDAFSKLDALKSWQGISSNVSSPGPVYLIHNLVQQETETLRLARNAVERPIRHGIFPTTPPPNILLYNVFDSRPSFAWSYDDLFFVRGRLRFVNKTIPSVYLCVMFDYPKWKDDKSQNHIVFTNIKTCICKHSTQSHMTPLKWLCHNELLATLPPETLMQCTSSDHLISFLERLDKDHYKWIYDNCSKLKDIVTTNNALLLREPSDGKCFVQKRIFDRERLERQTIVIELVMVEHTSKKHIFTEPMLDWHPNAADELGQGIVCIERILSDPYRFLVCV